MVRPTPRDRRSRSSPALHAVLFTALVVALLTAPALPAQETDLPVDLAVIVLGPDGQIGDALDPGDTATARVTITNGHNATINVTFTVNPGTGFTTRSFPTGPRAPNTTVHSNVPFKVPETASPGRRTVLVVGQVQEMRDGNWTDAGNLTAVTSYQVRAPPEPFPLVPVAVGAAVVVGVAGAAAYLHLRRRGPTLPPEPTDREVQRGIEERRESIADAKRRDVLESIERARGRLERGEITQYQFDRIKEQKEEQLRELGGAGDLEDVGSGDDAGEGDDEGDDDDGDRGYA